MSYTSVQFVGMDAALKAYQHRDIAPWALFINKQMLFKYDGGDIAEGQDQLSNVLQMCSGSKATYTLRVYEDIPGGKIKSATPDDGSFNFRLTDELPNGGQVGGGLNFQLMQELKELREENKRIIERLELQESDGDGGQVSGIEKYVTIAQQVMSIPGVGEIVSGIIRGFVPGAGQRIGIAGAFDQPASEQSDAINKGDAEQEELNRVLLAYLTIREGMPGALPLLEKLAEMYKTDRKKFDQVKTMIGFAI